MNNTWEIEIESPLLRPGLKIRTTVSERYLVRAMQLGINAIREFNNPEPQGDPTCGKIPKP